MRGTRTAEGNWTGGLLLASRPSTDGRPVAAAAERGAVINIAGPPPRSRAPVWLRLNSSWKRAPFSGKSGPANGRVGSEKSATTSSLQLKWRSNCAFRVVPPEPDRHNAHRGKRHAGPSTARHRDRLCPKMIATIVCEEVSPSSCRVAAFRECARNAFAAIATRCTRCQWAGKRTRALCTRIVAGGNWIQIGMQARECTFVQWPESD